MFDGEKRELPVLLVGNNVGASVGVSGKPYAGERV